MSTKLEPACVLAQPTRRRLMAALATLNCCPTLAATYRKLVVPYPAGGTTDQVARLIAGPLAHRWDIPLVVENRPGASGTLGTLHAARAAPDGSTLCIGTISTLVLLPHLRDTQYHPLHSFEMIGSIGEAPMLVVVNASLPAKDLTSLIDLFQRHPEQYNFGSVGEGSLPHWAGLKFQQATGTRLTHIPYAGAPKAVLDLMAGRAQVMFDQVATFSPSLLQSGALRALAVMGPKRLTILPDVPTTQELGFGGLTATMWMGLIAPARTPATIVSTYASDLQAVMREESVLRSLRAVGIEGRPGDAAMFRAFVQSQWGAFAQSAPGTWGDPPKAR